MGVTRDSFGVGKGRERNRGGKERIGSRRKRKCVKDLRRKEGRANVERNEAEKGGSWIMDM